MSPMIPLRAAALLGLLLLSSPACRDPAPDGNSRSEPVDKGQPKPVAEPTKVSVPDPPPPPQPAVACPNGMNEIPEGQFWVGTERETFDHEENPRFQTQVAAFCAGTSEVSTEDYEACVAAGDCTPTTSKNKTCNTVAKGRGNHPINCVDWHQADTYCRAHDARLPTEIEWEYLARGGSKMLDYPWGADAPDGHTCWKNPSSCRIGEYPSAAFGLNDVVGNLWEWTGSWFAPYPWPQAEGRHRVFRGGSWSRRFDKWMRPSLRNRVDPKKSGSHLGFRCVKSQLNAPCPYGKREDAESPSAGGPHPQGPCRFGVDQVQCLDGQTWNGARCAAEADNRICPGGSELVPGQGCVRPKTLGKVTRELDTGSVVRARSPEFDSDCAANAPGRPSAYRLTGGGHLARNAVGKENGCKNRDVGVGWNSACCP